MYFECFSGYIQVSGKLSENPKKTTRLDNNEKNIRT